MKACQRGICLSFWIFLACLWGMGAQAEGFAPTLSQWEGQPGDVVEVSFPYGGATEEVAAFRTQVEYDPEIFQYLRVSYGESVQLGTVTTHTEPGLVATVYTAPGFGPFLMEEATVTYRFRVLEGASPGPSSFFASAFELSSPEARPIAGDVDLLLDYQVLAPPSSDARLMSLTPDHGALSPSFSPEIFTYTMTVPSEVDAVDLYSGSDVRRNLSCKSEKSGSGRQ